MTVTIEGVCTKVWSATATKPLAGVYVLASVMLALSFQNPIYIVGCIVVLGFAACAAVMYLLHQEVAVVHSLVNSQHDDLVDRVTQLVDALEASHTPVPASHGGTRE